MTQLINEKKINLDKKVRIRTKEELQVRKIPIKIFGMRPDGREGLFRVSISVLEILRKFLEILRNALEMPRNGLEMPRT